MLTVDYDKLGLKVGDRLLDIGAGFGRHAFEAFRRGARPVACDLALAELRSCNATFAAMVEAEEVNRPNPAPISNSRSPTFRPSLS